MKDSDLGGEKFGVLWGLQIYSSDTISSVAYAGEEVLMVLLPVMGLLAAHTLVYVMCAIIALLLILVFCYRQTIDAYPQGGGAYIVGADNLGEAPGLTAASSLLVGYIPDGGGVELLGRGGGGVGVPGACGIQAVDRLLLSSAFLRGATSEACASRRSCSACPRISSSSLSSRSS